MKFQIFNAFFIQNVVLASLGLHTSAYCHKMIDFFRLVTFFISFGIIEIFICIFMIYLSSSPSPRKTAQIVFLLLSSIM